MAVPNGVVGLLSVIVRARSAGATSHRIDRASPSSFGTGIYNQVVASVKIHGIIPLVVHPKPLVDGVGKCVGTQGACGGVFLSPSMEAIPASVRHAWAWTIEVPSASL